MAQASNNHRDLVCIDNLRLSANIGPDRWKKSRSQPLLVSVALHADLSIAGLKDELTGSINYGTLSKVIIKEAQADETRVFSGLEDLAENISRIAFSLAPKSPEVSVSLTAPKLLLYDAIAQLSIVRHPSSIEASKTWKWCINRWKAFVIIGLNPEEREEKQVLFTDLQMSFENENKTGMRVDIPSIINRAAEFVDGTSFLTLEKFASELIWTVMRQHGDIANVTVRVSKPSAITFADAAFVIKETDQSNIPSEKANRRS